MSFVIFYIGRYQYQLRAVQFIDEMDAHQKPNPEKVRYKVIGVEMKGMESSIKLVALGATQRKG